MSLKCILTYNTMLFVSWTLRKICLFKFMLVEVGVKYMKHLGGGVESGLYMY
jgi:hypothetical protein